MGHWAEVYFRGTSRRFKEPEIYEKVAKEEIRGSLEKEIGKKFQGYRKTKCF